jgi:predicted N-acetyltransferase YhbS
VADGPFDGGFPHFHQNVFNRNVAFLLQGHSMPIQPFLPAHDAAVNGLLDQCFGPARQRRTAALLRAGARRCDDRSFVASIDGAVAGAVQVWPLWLDSAPLLLLGPLVCAPAHRGRGIGAALMDAAIAAIGAVPVLLIGDAGYYGRWGFTADHTAGWRLPGPVDRARLLLRGPAPADRGTVSATPILSALPALPAGRRAA